MTAAAAKKLVVCGGDSFLGSRICKYAVARGWDIVFISRSGQPQWEAVTASAAPPPWAHRVSWKRADLLSPATYAPLPRHANFVVHSMGILLEADYKGVLRGTESPFAVLRTMFAPRSPPDRGADPLAKPVGEDIKPDDPSIQFSYEVMNRDSAVALARHAAQANKPAPAFLYVSACAGAPLMPPRYISTKREAESTIAANFPAMRTIFARPPFMYDSSRKLTMGLAAAVGAGSLFNNLTGNYPKDFMGAAGTKPLKIDLVAEAIVEALSNDTVKGPIEVPQLEELAARAWRKNVL